MMRYPFSPEILDALPEELAELFRGLEMKLLEEICSRLKIAGQLNEVTVQDIRALRSHGIDLEEIKKAISETTNTGMDQLEKLMDDVVERNQKYYTELIDFAKVTAPERLVDERDIAAIRRQTWAAYKNITGSMGFLVVRGGRLTFLEPAKAYENALDSALLQVQSGAISYNQAIAAAVKQLADGGMKTVDYESGHADSVDVAVRRAVMTGVSQVCDQYDTQVMEDLDTPYCQISAHRGARDIPTPNPWSSHKDWQGKVYYQSQNGEPDPLGKYPDLAASTGYGYVDGLKGANCRHRKFAWVEGVSERTYTDEQLANIDPPPFAFEGRMYTAYEATQKQRQIERTIRKLKRRKAAFEAAGLTEDAQAANIRLRRLNQEYKAFSEAAGLPEQRERMKALYAGDITDDKDFASLKEYQGSIKVVGQFSPKEYVVKLAPPTISGTTQHFADNLANKPDRVGLTVEAAQSIINNSKLVLYQPSNITLKFLDDKGYVVLNLQGEIVTAVPEKLRKKYRDFLKEKSYGKKS